MSYCRKTDFVEFHSSFVIVYYLLVIISMYLFLRDFVDMTLLSCNMHLAVVYNFIATEWPC